MPDLEQLEGIYGNVQTNLAADNLEAFLLEWPQV